MRLDMSEYHYVEQMLQEPAPVGGGRVQGRMATILSEGRHETA